MNNQNASYSEYIMLKKGGRILPNSLMRFRGQPIEVRDRRGIVHRGIMDGFDPPRRGMFIRDRFGRRRFIPFFLIFAIFSRRRRIF
jgi:hypothetical protein